MGELALLLFLLTVRPPVAPEMYGTVDVGKVYSIERGEYITATMPGAELVWGGWRSSMVLVFDGGALIERDITAGYSFNLGKKVEVSAGVNYYRYSVAGFDWTWSTGVRVRVR